MTPRRQSFQLKLLRMLVEELGYDEVQKALAQLSEATGGTYPTSVLDVRPPQALSRKEIRPKRPTAVEQVEKLADENCERDSLLAIAAKFDRKEFLPSVADIREFLAMMGESSNGMKDRLDGFRRLLPPLAQLPSERLKRLAASRNFSGPAQLGPLSEAIRSTGEAIRRSEKVPEPEQKS